MNTDDSSPFFFSRSKVFEDVTNHNVRFERTQEQEGRVLYYGQRERERSGWSEQTRH